MHRVGDDVLDFGLKEDRIRFMTWAPVEDASLTDGPAEALARVAAVSVGSDERRGLRAGHLERLVIALGLGDGKVLHAGGDRMLGVGDNDVERFAVVDVVAPRANVF